MQRTGPRTGTQNCRSRLNKFKVFVQIFANIFDTQSDISKQFNVLTLKRTFFKENYTFSNDKMEENIDNQNLLCWTYFRSDFRRFLTSTTSISLNFVEAVANLFMKLQTLTITKLFNLGIKLEII